MQISHKLGVGLRFFEELCEQLNTQALINSMCGPVVWLRNG